MTKPAEAGDFRAYYDLETYLFETVTARFQANGELSAFDFFCVVIWKANRAKSKIAKRLVSSGKYADLEAAVRALTMQISAAQPAREKLRILIESWGFLLPMASAILTVLYPDEFTVYDERVCDQLRDFTWVKNKTIYEDIWDGYSKYAAAVRQATPQSLSLRDKDRWLWGKSFVENLRADIAHGFARDNEQ